MCAVWREHSRTINEHEIETTNVWMRVVLEIGNINISSLLWSKPVTHKQNTILSCIETASLSVSSAWSSPFFLSRYQLFRIESTRFFRRCSCIFVFICIVDFTVANLWWSIMQFCFCHRLGQCGWQKRRQRWKKLARNAIYTKIKRRDVIV